MKWTHHFPRSLRAPALGLLGLIGLTWWVFSSMPFAAPMPHSVAPSSGAFEDYFRGVTIGAPLSGSWSLREIRESDSALTALITDGERVFDVYYSHPDFERRPGSLRMTWFKRYVPETPEDDEADFSRAVHVLSVALERGSVSARPWSYALFPANLPRRVYQASFLLLLAALLWVARRELKVARPHLSTLISAGLLMAAGLYVRLAFSPAAPLHANLHGLEELDQLVFPLNSPYPGYYGAVQESLEDLLLWCLPRSAAVFFAAHAFIGVLAAGAAGLLAKALTSDRAAGLFTLALALFSPQLIRVSTSESGFLWIILLLFVSLLGLVRYAQHRDMAGLIIGALGALLLTHLHAITPVFLALPAAAWFVVPKGRRRSGLFWLGTLTIALGVLLVPHLSFLLELHQGRGGSLLSETLPILPARLMEPGNLVFRANTGPAILPLAALAGVVLLWWKRRGAAALITLLSPVFVISLLLQTCWSDMVRYQAPLAAWITLPAGIGLSMGLSLIARDRWRYGVTVALILLGGLTFVKPWTGHLRPDIEAQEYMFLDQTVADLPQHGIMVKVTGVRTPPGISGYFPMTVFREHGKSYLVVDADELPNLVARGALGDEPLFFYRGLGWAWLEHHELEASEDVDPEEREAARAVQERTRWGISGFTEEIVARHRVLRQFCPATGFRMDFNELPGPYAELEMVRLRRIGEVQRQAPDISGEKR